MELHGTIAVWQGADHLTLYDATQGVYEVRHRMADLFELPQDNVRVISRYLGGGFGSKGSPWSHVALAALAARVVGRAVKLVVTRPQMFSLVGHRPRTIQRVRLAARADGQLVAVAHDVTSHTSRFDDFAEPSAYATRMLYACPNVKTSHRLVRLDLPTPTFTRAPGEASGSFALESALDELAYALKLDPVALRVANHADADADLVKPYSSKSLLACYTQAAEKFGWARRRTAVRSMREGHTLVGWGMATATYPARLSPASALARIRADGTALVQTATQDLGTGTYTIMTQVAADALGLPVDKVRFELGDTALPEAPLSAGSRTAASVGSAVRKAALAAVARMALLAVTDPGSPLHGLAPDRVVARDGGLAGDGKTDPYAAILARRRLDQIEEQFDNKEDEERKKFSTHAFGAQFAEVRVDEDLAEVRVSRVVSAFACGKVLNAKTARSQLMGGVVWGIGMALLEKTERDERTGRVVSRDLADYHLPTNADVPAVEFILVPEDDPIVSAVGAKGMGEIGIVGAGAAIANAVYHATGTRVRELPITIDRLL
jgi:xanthine dehydrogenase YagR molybdenum-binding subunit